MARAYFCLYCGWEGVIKAHDLKDCPRCGKVAERYLTTWDHVAPDVLKVFFAIIMFSWAAFLWTWLMYPYHKDEPAQAFVVHFQMNSVSLIDSPNGSVARFSFKNDSNRDISRTELSILIHAWGRSGSEPAFVVVGGPKSVTVGRLAPSTETFFDVPIERRSGAELFGWTAKITSLKLDPGYWNERLERALSARIDGVGNSPVPFEQTPAVPHAVGPTTVVLPHGQRVLLQRRMEFAFG